MKPYSKNAQLDRSRKKDRIPKKQRAKKRTKAIRKSPYDHPAWRALRLEVRKRSGDICEGCRQGPAAHVHHVAYAPGRGWRRLIVPIKKLLHLCIDCHNRAHPLNFKGDMLNAKLLTDFLDEGPDRR